MELSIMLKALGDPTRLFIYRQLLARKHCTRSLSRLLGISEPAVSQHLKVLREAGMVRREKYGYHTHYLPVEEALDELVAHMEAMRQAFLAADSDSLPCRCESRSGNMDEIIKGIKSKEDRDMRIAVTYENGNIFQHFGHTEQFKLYDVRDGEVKASQVVSADGFGHGALANFLRGLGVDALICGGIGGGARMALEEAGIELYGGVDGGVDDAVAALIAGNLGFDPDVRCSHHGEHHHEDGHACGNHGCGSHGCH